MRVFTSDVWGAGTDSDVSVVIVGEDGDTGAHRLDSSKNDFERNTIGNYFVNGPNIGALTSLVVEMKAKGFGPDWHLSHVEVSNSATGEVAVFPYHDWIRKGDAAVELWPDRSDVNSIAPNAGPPQFADRGFAFPGYSLALTTQDAPDAGTDSTVHAEVQCEYGSLNAAVEGMEPGQATELHLHSAEDLGDVLGIKLWTDGSGSLKTWGMRTAVVKHLGTMKSWEFHGDEHRIGPDGLMILVRRWPTSAVRCPCVCVLDCSCGGLF